MEDGTTDMQWQNRSRKAALNEAGSPWIARWGALTPGTKIAFHLRSILGSTTLAEGVGGITYAWGF